MAELPTVAAPSTTPETARALAAIEASKLLSEADVAECLTAIGDLIRITGAPETIYDWVLHVLGAEALRQFAAQQHIVLHASRAADEEQLPRAAVIWTAGGTGMAIVPQELHPRTALLHLREEVARRDEELQMAASFQASVAAGHVEDIDAWHARTSTAGR